MSQRDMTVSELVKVLWNNKIKVAALLLAIVFGPGVYGDWQEKRAARQLEADRRSVNTDASIAGAMLMSAWKSCAQIGIVNDMERCAAYRGELLQEQATSPLAKLAIERRAYYKNCQRFHPYWYCQQLLDRSVRLSNAQSKE